MIKNFTKSLIVICFSVSTILFCTDSKDPEIAGTFLARVGSQVITEEDFVRRAEFSIRPQYCAGNNAIHKKIVLNSLIAEKLLALEEHSQSDLDTNRMFQDYLTGLKEQAMRQWLFHEQGENKVVVVDEELQKAVGLALRSYALEYFTVPNSGMLNQVLKDLDDGYDFGAIYSAITGADSLPVKEIGWFDKEEAIVHQRIFSDTLEVGQILPPVKTADGNYLMIRITDYFDRVLLSPVEIADHHSRVRKEFHAKQAHLLYDDYIREVMRAKRFVLNEAVFIPYAASMASRYYNAAKSKQDMFNQEMWGAEHRPDSGRQINEIPVGPQEQLFTLDDEPWTVKDFESYLRRHPLIFRKKDMPHAEFPEQLKFAIADLLRDFFLTEKAYELGYDQSSVIRQNVELWEDHYLGRHHRAEYLKSRIPPDKRTEMDQQEILEQWLQPLLDSLQQKYSTDIQIDVEAFNKLEISNIQAFATRPDLPFPVLVPSFPVLTMDHELDYGSRYLKPE